jgi:hypothetical protein
MEEKFSRYSVLNSEGIPLALVTKSALKIKQNGERI